jgi:integrase
VRLCGKSAKIRLCPLWPRTMAVLAPLIAHRPTDSLVFLNHYGAPITHFGIHTLVERHAKRASERLPSLAKKRVSPHTIRHTTATHLLRLGLHFKIDLCVDVGGVDGNTPYRVDVHTCSAMGRFHNYSFLCCRQHRKLNVTNRTM